MTRITYYFKSLSTLALCILFTAAYAQEGKLKRANKEYNELAYIDAAKIYRDVAESGFKSEELFKKLGNTYYFNADYREASKWYGELFAMSPTVEPIYHLRYSQSLNAVGKEQDAKQWYNSFIAEAGISSSEFSAKEYLKRIENNSGRYNMKPLSINSSGVDFGARILDDKLIFASTRDTGVVHRRRSAWDGLSFLDIYEASYDESDGSIGKPHKLKGKVNTKFHESSAVFSNDGQTMYFTRNNVSPGIKQNKDQEMQLKIYRAQLEDGQWTHIEDLSINSDNYSNAHPALSPNGDILYFVSNMPQAIGLTDLFMVKINADGSLGVPTNLGENVNTKGRESFPYITKDNELYFSSDGHFGLGGYDVFYVQLKGYGYEGDLLNVGKPINSADDDVAFIINNHKGFVSSNRLGGMGHDDIYSFIETKDIKDIIKSKVYGVITDIDTNQPLTNAIVTVSDGDGNTVATLQTDASGNYETIINPTASYIIKVSKTDYDSDDTFSNVTTEDRQHNFKLKRNKEDIIEGLSIESILNIIIYFDLDRSNIRPDAEVELEKIVAVMKQHPDLKIDIRSHTDSRANDRYNIALSERRAQATLNYLVSRGISQSRLTAKGYGETQLLNACYNGIKCNDYEHEKNRRSEFIIIK